jgi:MinD-like ATPase involved in chromosome partitioning or flagellar assembly
VPGHVCTVAGGKGGVGKTTVAINIAAAMQEADHDVAIDDTVKTAALADRSDVPLLAVVPDDAGATGTEPLVRDAPDTPAAEAFRRFGELLAGVFFEGLALDAVDPVMESE